MNYDDERVDRVSALFLKLVFVAFLVGVAAGAALVYCLMQ